MAFLRRDRPVSDDVDQDLVDDSEDAPTPDLGLRTGGPWDASERQTAEDPTYVDLGALRIRGRVGLEIRLQTDGEGEDVGASLVVTEDSALELRAFAGPRSGGLWDEVRADLVDEVGRMEGDVDEVDGAFGPELRVRVPMTFPDGEAGFQPSRIIGIEGPRWLLRATLLGKAALEPSDDHVLIETLRDVVVDRGDGPRAAREPLLLTIPESAVVLAEEDVTDPTIAPNQE